MVNISTVQSESRTPQPVTSKRYITMQQLKHVVHAKEIERDIVAPDLLVGPAVGFADSSATSTATAVGNCPGVTWGLTAGMGYGPIPVILLSLPLPIPIECVFLINTPSISEPKSRHQFHTTFRILYYP